MSEKYFQQPSIMSAQQHFGRNPSIEIPRSRFDRSHAYKTTFDAGKLIPVFVDEVLPGDTFELSSTCFARLATPLKPFMDNIYLDVHFFFVPNRLTWENWAKFCGERVNPDDDPNDYSMPQAIVDVTTEMSVARYFGLPLQPSGSDISVCALPFRAYNLVYNEWYRDQNFLDSVSVPTGDATDSTLFKSVLPFNRGKRHDYFTSCLPWPQKGDPVLLPFGETAPVRTVSPLLSPAQQGIMTGMGSPGDINAGNSNGVLFITGYPGGGGNSSATLLGSASNSDFISAGVYSDLASATAVSINDLRLAITVQQMLERDARGGTRYIEKIFNFFGVRSPDARLQRPEFLGGGSTRINVNPIASTAETTDVPQANLAAVATGLQRGGFVKSFTEHGFVIGIASARADLTYQNGIERFWSRTTVNDLYWPPMAHLGEQAVLNKEIFYSSNPTIDNAVFGYQERWAEYRYKPSRVTGLFSSNSVASLDVWHLCQDFTECPVLTQDFIFENPPIDRVIAVNTEPHFLADFWFRFVCSRPMPVFSVPGLGKL